LWDALSSLLSLSSRSCVKPDMYAVAPCLPVVAATVRTVSMCAGVSSPLGMPRACMLLQGQLAYRVYSYTPLPVEEGTSSQRVRVAVGPTTRPQPRTFVFGPALSQPSQLVTVTLPRPLGVVFEEDKRLRRVVVAEVVPRSRAGQRAALAKFDRSKRVDAALPGDVLRAVTCTNLVWPAKSLVFGMKPPQRHIVLFGADNQKWEKVANALKQGLVADGPVTLVLERDLEAG
jgi:hypothetical protein